MLMMLDLPLSDVILKHFASLFQSPLQDVLASTENSVDGLIHLEDEQYLCPTESGYVQPLRALNAYGKWRIIVNHVKAHYETLSQTARDGCDGCF